MKKVIFLLLIYSSIIRLLGCSNNENRKDKLQTDSLTCDFPIKIEMEKFVDTQFQEINLSTIADSIEYIPLETTQNSLIDGVAQAILTDSLVFIKSYSHKILQFKRNGKFLRQIGSEGRGPGQYHGLRGISVDNEQKVIFIHPNYAHKIIKYSYDNKFLGDIPLSKTDLASDVSFIGKNNFIATGVFMMPVEKTPDMFLTALIDSLGKQKLKVNSPLIQFPDYIKRKDVYYQGTHIPSYFDSIALSLGTGCDTVYATNYDSIVPRYILERGKYNCPLDVKYGFSMNKGIRKKMRDEKDKSIQIMNSPIETKEYLFIRFCFKNYAYLAAYNKKSALSSVFRIKGIIKNDIMQPIGDLDYGFKNDLDGGSRYYPRWTNFGRKEWIRATDAFQMIDQLPEFKAHSDGNNKQELLIQLIENLKVDDNPVLEVAHLNN